MKHYKGTGNISKKERIYVAMWYTDMRKSIDELATIAQQNFELIPFQNSLLPFYDIKRDRIKVLYCEGDSFVPLYKRFENRCFQWPKDAKVVKCIVLMAVRRIITVQPKAVKKVDIQTAL